MEVSGIIETIVNDLGYEFTEGNMEYLNATIHTFDLQNKDVISLTPITEQSSYINGVESETTQNVIIRLCVKNDGEYQSTLDETYLQKRERRLKAMKTQIKTIIKKIGCNESLEIRNHRIFDDINQLSENIDMLMAEFNFIYYE